MIERLLDPVPPRAGPRHKPAQAALAVALLALLALASACSTTAPSRLAAEWYDIGNEWYDQGSWARAGAAYSRAIALDPELAAASYNLGRALAESGDYEGALKAMDGVLAADPSNVRALTARAWIHYKSGDAKAALADYSKVLALEPSSPDALVNASILRLEAGDLDAVISGLSDYVGTKAEDEKALIVYARALAGKGLTEEALAAYGKVATPSRLDGSDHANLARMYEETRDFAKAISEYVKVTAADPKDATALFALARLRLAEAEDAEAGLDALQKALDAGFSDKVAARDLLAEPGLAGREKATELLKAKGLVE